MYKFNPSTVNEATAASSQPPYTMMSVFEPWPEYTSLFHERPECAAEVARDLFHAQDPRYLPFILSFPTEEDIYQTPEALQFDEFLLTMLDIASNELWYIQLRETASPENFIKLSRISSQLHWTLISIGRLLITSGGKVLHPLNAELCLQCTQRLPGLWKLLWEHRSIVLVERFEGADTHILTLVRYLLECHFFMDQQFQQHTPTLESYVPHVAFYAWCHAGNLKPKNSAHSCAYIVLDILNTLSLDGLHDFTTDVVSVVIGQKNPLDVFSDALLAVDQELLQPSQLHRHLSLSMFVLRRTEDLSESEVPAESRTKALYALARAFQRYHCNGDMEGAPYASRKISKAVLYCFYAISACDQDGVAKDLNDHPYDLNFMQVVVSALDDAYVPPCDLSLAHQDSILILITLYGIYGKHARTSTIPEVARNYGYLRRLLQVHWLPVLNNLRSASRLPELKSNQNRDTLDKLLTVTEKWKQLGDVYGFSKRSREDDRLETLISYVSPEERLQGCSLTECPCYGRKDAYHKTRRVCKGCWLAFYCSTRCQKRHWKLGHRSVCRSSSN